MWPFIQRVVTIVALWEKRLHTPTIYTLSLNWSENVRRAVVTIAAVHIFEFLQKSSLNLSFIVPHFLGLAVSEWAIILENFAINDKRFDLSDNYRLSLILSHVATTVIKYEIIVINQTTLVAMVLMSVVTGLVIYFWSSNTMHG